jgi:hypothetical protein
MSLAPEGLSTVLKYLSLSAHSYPETLETLAEVFEPDNQWEGYLTWRTVVEGEGGEAPRSIH